MYHLLYSSLVTSPISREELDELLHQSRIANEARGVTGMLAYGNRTFVQLLEGPEPAVQNVFRKVRRDLRHTQVRILAEGPVPARTFDDWAMGFRRLDGAAVPPGWVALDAADNPEDVRAAAAKLFAELRADLAHAYEFD